MRTFIRRFLAVAATGLAAAGCSSSDTGAATGQLVLRLTDAPGADIQSATVWVSKVYVFSGSDSVGSRIDIATYSPAKAFDLTSLANGVTTLLGSATIPIGDYSQVRLVVDSAQVTLEPPLTFAGGLATISLQTPSAMQSGIKVNLGGLVHVAPGQTVLVVDFDVSQSFVLLGPLGAPTGMIFKPVCHGTTTDIAAAITGTVSPAASKAEVLAITGAGDTVATALADTLTGTYMLHFLDPRLSPFTVAAVAAGYGTQTRSVSVLAGQTAAGVNFALTP